jgi:hypothetical protein
MAKVWVAPTGRLSQGHVLDVSKKPFERALRDYDPQLYVRWNPKKLKGWGCWEIRRRPEKNNVIEIVPFGGNTYVHIGPVELDIVNHTLDLAFMNYSVLNKLKSMDTWKNPNWAKDLERAEAEHREKVIERDRQNLKYMVQEEKSAIRDIKQAILSGANPHLIGKHWGS